MNLWSPEPLPWRPAVRAVVAVLVSVLLLFSGGSGTVYALGPAEESSVSVEFAATDDCVADTRSPRSSVSPSRRSCLPPFRASASPAAPSCPLSPLADPEGPASSAGPARNDVLRC
ncbi:hypothetical protein FGW37_02325 [Streptomyces rectiverticillatus]|uniref:hypothetical protein n=1 Tax=Streptomyces rectiverticillatus TaxID=173860 RepID=UPI0015C370D5|nr:hypothetical protein [Streptomyces rectiverticillatus]QLE70595.1 hypothetical protein FGW37_02325 [Streptomyces rectiverticillatus]